MRPCYKQCIQTREKRDGQIIFNSFGSPRILFLDDLRIGLRMRQFLLQVDNAVVDLSMAERPDNAIKVKKLALEETVLMPGLLYIAITQEEFRLPSDVLGWIYTRSKYARVGFNAVASSRVIIPGYGQTRPTPLVLELSVLRPTVGLKTDEAYAFLLLFELDEPTVVYKKDYWNRFPYTLDSVLREL